MTRSLPAAAFATALLLLGLAATQPARASLWDTFGFGARGTAMAGAQTASSVDYDSVYYNPANLLSRKETHFGLGLNLIAPKLKVVRARGEGAFEPLTPKKNVGIHLGVSTPIGGVFKDKLAFGFSLFHPVVNFTRIESIDPATPYFYRYQNLTDKLIIAFGVAGEPVEWLRLGFGIQVLAGLAGTFDASVSLVEGRFTRQTIDVKVDVVAAPIYSVGVGPFHGLRFGATWRSPLSLSYRLPITVLIEELGLLDVQLSGTSLYTPGQLALGVSWESTSHNEPGFTVEAGLTWERWHKAPPAAATFELTVDDSVIRADAQRETGRETQNIIEALGPPIPLGALDTVTPRAGVEWRPTPAWAVRAGYLWRPTPIPRQRYQTNSLDATAHVYSIGGGFAFRDPTRIHRAPLHVDLALQVSVLNRRVVRKVADGTPDGAYYFDGAVYNLVLDIRHDF